MPPHVFDGTQPPPLVEILDIEHCSRVVKIKLTPDVIKSWLTPYWQRPVRFNAKGRQLTEDIKLTRKLDSVMIVGVVKKRNGKFDLYLVDGHHRKAAFLRSGAPYMDIDVKFVYVDKVEELSPLYLNCQEQITKSTANDNLQGLAVTNEVLQHIKSKCEFITYEGVRLGTIAHSINMSTVVQIWYDSMLDPPKKNTLTPSVSITELAKKLTVDDADHIVQFMTLCRDNFEFKKLSSGLWLHINLVLCLWLFRVLVLREVWEGGEVYKVKHLTPRQFGVGLLGLKNDKYYLTLMRKKLNSSVDRKEAYQSIAKLFASNLRSCGVVSNPKLPRPQWAYGKKG